ncbi:efflux RND transporter periplasmic adaptor subunit [Nostoc sp.]|uniref:efflux RND transporter periplasmic adaptor subunit n=1 Tax=Nostoc sp. TaxID=1180 RepID=UPI002FF4F6FD
MPSISTSLDGAGAEVSRSIQNLKLSDGVEYLMSLDRPFESVSSEPTADLKNSAANGSGSVLAPVSTAPINTEETASKPPRQRKTWLWVILAVLLIGGGGFVGWQLLGKREAPPPPAPPPLPVKVQTVESSQVQSTSEFVGTLEAQQRVSLQPQIQGRIERIFVASGDRVSKGTPILSLSLDQTTANVSSAIATVNSNRAAVVTAQAQLEQQQANEVKAAADVKLQQVQFRRTKMLVTEGAQARQELDIAQNNLDAAIATLNAAKKQVISCPLDCLLNSKKLTPAKAMLCLPSPQAGRGWGWGVLTVVSITNYADMI